MKYVSLIDYTVSLLRRKKSPKNRDCHQIFKFEAPAVLKPVSRSGLNLAQETICHAITAIGKYCGLRKAVTHYTIGITGTVLKA